MQYDTTASTQTLAMHWDGNEWTIVPTPNVGAGFNYIFGLAALASDDVWAVGMHGTYEYRQTLAMHWDGSEWTIVPTPNVGARDNYLRAAAATSTTDVWAVGNYHSGSGERTLILHWDGSAWSVVSSPSLGNASTLYGVTALSAGNACAVGFASTGSRGETLALRWDGSQWAIGPSANPGSATNYLYDVEALAPNDMWAVGMIGDGALRRTLVERYTGTCTPTCHVEYSDVPADSPFYAAIRCLVCRGIIGGYDDGTFRPNNGVTRGQNAKFISNSAGYDDYIPPDRQTYEDVPPGHPFWLWIERLTLHFVVGGYQCGGAGEPCGPGQRPYFRPYNPLTRAQLAIMASRAAGFNEPVPVGAQTFADIPPTHPFYLVIERMARRGIMDGYACGAPPAGPCDAQRRPWFIPQNHATRGQTAKIVANTFYPNCYTP